MPAAREIPVYVRQPSRARKPTLESLDARLDILEAIARPTILAALNPPGSGAGGEFPPVSGGGITINDTTRTDTIVEPVRYKNKDCTVTTAVAMKYTHIATTTLGTPPNSTTTTRYRVDVTVTVTLRCPNEEDVTRTTTAQYFIDLAHGTTETAQTVESTGFDGSKKTSITYGSGTKVEVVKRGDKVTITVTYPDGTSVTTVLPP